MDLSMGGCDIRGSWLGNFWDSYLVPKRGLRQSFEYGCCRGGIRCLGLLQSSYSHEGKAEGSADGRLTQSSGIVELLSSQSWLIIGSTQGMLYKCRWPAPHQKFKKKNSWVILMCTLFSRGRIILLYGSLISCTNIIHKAYILQYVRSLGFWFCPHLRCIFSWRAHLPQCITHHNLPLTLPRMPWWASPWM